MTPEELLATSEKSAKKLEDLRIAIKVDMAKRKSEASITAGVTPRRALLLQAADTIDGDRNDTYGGPESSFKTIAGLWNEYLRTATGVSRIEPHDVAAMLALLKIARIAGSGGTHKDSWLDLAGYAACGWETVAQPPSADVEPVMEDIEIVQPYFSQPWPTIE